MSDNKESESKGIKWVDLQKKIHEIFGESEVRKFKDVVTKDVNGYNWILSFHDLRDRNSIIIHTNFIFKLSEDKQTLRKNEFLYLKDINCLYEIVSFDNLSELEAVINEILVQNMFGQDIINLSEFIIEPERLINNVFTTKKIEGYTIFSFQYYPNKAISACQDTVFEFDFNVNNNQDVKLTIKKMDKTKYKFKFDTGGKIYTTTAKNINNIAETIALFTQKYLDNN
jgi:hypothetical protein